MEPHLADRAPIQPRSRFRRGSILGNPPALISVITLSLLHNRWQWASHIWPIGFDKKDLVETKTMKQMLRRTSTLTDE
jgi:hypothetical protein